MDILLLLLCGLLPPLLIAWLSWRFLSARSRLPRHQVVLSLMLGFLSAVPAFYLQQLFHHWLRPDYAHWGMVFLTAFLIVALVEEVFKGLMLWSSTFLMHIDEGLDLLVISVLVSMGFAGVENILYSLSLGWEVALFRSLTAVPAHACFAFFVAYFAAMDFPSHKKVLPYLYGISLAWILHGIYDLFIIQEISETLMLWALVVLVISALLARSVYRRVRRSVLHDIKSAHSAMDNEN